MIVQISPNGSILNGEEMKDNIINLQERRQLKALKKAYEEWKKRTGYISPPYRSRWCFEKIGSLSSKYKSGCYLNRKLDFLLMARGKKGNKLV